jgi:PilZ domain-containing protein
LKIVEQENIHSTRWVNIRRSQRVVLNMPIAVSLQAENALVQSEESHTLVVNAHGALLKLMMNVQPGQTLVLKNRDSGEEQQCRVVHIDRRQEDSSEVGILFAHPAPRFWGVNFPPADWKPFLA